MNRLLLIMVFLCVIVSVNAAADTAPKKYTPVSRPHTWQEKVEDFGLSYAVLWVGYAVSQPDTVSGIRFKNFEDNVFRRGGVLWDHDAFAWNFIAHPYYGSEFYLYFRSRGYSPKWAFINTAIVSTIFEETIETFSEPFSTNDFVVTPILGGAVGWARERAGLRLVNSDNKFYRVAGHIIYLETNFPFFEKAEFVPMVSLEPGFTGFVFRASF